MSAGRSVNLSRGEGGRSKPTVLRYSPSCCQTDGNVCIIQEPEANSTKRVEGNKSVYVTIETMYREFRRKQPLHPPPSTLRLPRCCPLLLMWVVSSVRPLGLRFPVFHCRCWTVVVKRIKPIEYSFVVFIFFFIKATSFETG